MSTRGWHCLEPDLLSGERFEERVIAVHRQLYDTCFRHEPLINDGMGIEVRARRQLEGWNLLLLLTPWMLARLLTPRADPGIALPAGWDAGSRRGEAPLVLGPEVGFELMGQSHKAHLNYHAGLGHYLLQPLILNMSNFQSADEVFAAWNGVIRRRDANMEQRRVECPWQKEVSRREFMRGRVPADR